ncbi:unnamed protein product, partial [Medioppia subpectinata]
MAQSCHPSLVLAKDDNDRRLHKGLSDRSVENCVSRQESLFPTNCINHCTFMFEVNIFSSVSIKIAIAIPRRQYTRKAYSIHTFTNTFSSVMENIV